MRLLSASLISVLLLVPFLSSGHAANNMTVERRKTPTMTSGSLEAVSNRELEEISRLMRAKEEKQRAEERVEKWKAQKGIQYKEKLSVLRDAAKDHIKDGVWTFKDPAKDKRKGMYAGKFAATFFGISPYVKEFEKTLGFDSRRQTHGDKISLRKPSFEQFMRERHLGDAEKLQLYDDAYGTRFVNDEIRNKIREQRSEEERKRELEFPPSIVALGTKEKRASMKDYEGAIERYQEHRKGEEVQLTLEKCIQIALEDNLSIGIAALTRDALKPEVEIANAFFDPAIGAAFIATDEKTASDQDPPSKVDTQTLSAFVRKEIVTGGSIILSSDFRKENESGKDREYGSNVTLSIIQPLLRGGRVYVATRPIKDAEFNLQIEEATLQAQILRVIADTKKAYYNVTLAENIINVTEKAIERDRTLIEASKALYEAGLGGTRDILNSMINLAKDETRLASAQADLENALNALLDVLGRSFAAKILLLDKEITYGPVPLKLKEWVAHALENRPEILRVNEKLAQSDLNVRTFKNGVLPQLDFVTSYGRSQIGSTLNNTLDFEGREWSAGLVFSIPFGNVAAKSELSRAKTEHRQLLLERSQVQRLVELEVRTAVIRLQESAARIVPLRNKLELSKALLEVAKGRFSLGLATNEDITDALEDMLDADTDLLSSIVDYNTALAELEAAIAKPIFTQ